MSSTARWTTRWAPATTDPTSRAADDAAFRVVLRAVGGHRRRGDALRHGPDVHRRRRVGLPGLPVRMVVGVHRPQLFDGRGGLLRAARSAGLPGLELLAVR